MNVKYLRELLADLDPEMLIGVAYPDHQSGPEIAYNTVDIRGARVTATDEKFDGIEQPVLVLIAHGGS